MIKDARKINCHHCVAIRQELRRVDSKLNQLRFYNFRKKGKLITRREALLVALEKELKNDK